MENDPFDDEPEVAQEQEPEIITVDQFDEWKFIEAGNIGETTALGPCIGVILYDRETKQALVGHFDVHMEAVTEMLEEAKKRFPNIENIDAYVGGGVLSSEDAPDFTYDKERRSFVEESLQKAGIKKIKVKYAELIESTWMTIDTRTGEVGYETEDFDFNVGNREEDDD